MSGIVCLVITFLRKLKGKVSFSSAACSRLAHHLMQEEQASSMIVCLSMFAFDQGYYFLIIGNANAIESL